MSKSLCVDLFAGLGGWSEGFLAEGYDCIGFDIERHDYGTGGYPGQLVLQDVRTLHGSQFKDAAVIVASPPCQFFSYTAMPWSRAKALAVEVRASQIRYAKELELFIACFRIAAEAGVPLIVENVRGAQPWVGPAKWNYGSFYLWGDVPALMPMTFRGVKVPGLNWPGSDKPGYVAKAFNTTAEQGLKLAGNNGPRRWEDREIPRLGDALKEIPHAPAGRWMNPNENSLKQGGEWWHDPQSMTRRYSSRSAGRKAASAQIAKIPFPLSLWIAKCFKESYGTI